MRVKLKVYFHLPGPVPPNQGRDWLDLPEGTEFKSLIAGLGLSSPARYLALINGRPARDETRLKDGDEVVLFPPVDGG
ncbi:MAG: MoaD/ThiS family protein [Thermodesulfobacteriota bacterium]